ncbi:MAG: hypothetical protein GF333_01010 [Candidatus Omnitrophica bacterium]|nr:hypothetical protein [Candidatus Omnitrophota bacterium]
MNSAQKKVCALFACLLALLAVLFFLAGAALAAVWATALAGAALFMFFSGRGESSAGPSPGRIWFDWRKMYPALKIIVIVICAGGIGFFGWEGYRYVVDLRAQQAAGQVEIVHWELMETSSPEGLPPMYDLVTVLRNTGDRPIERVDLMLEYYADGVLLRREPVLRANGEYVLMPYRTSVRLRKEFLPFRFPEQSHEKKLKVYRVFFR